MTSTRTLAVVGAGPGFGLSVAKRFGAAGFQVALLARDGEKLQRLVAELGALDVAAHAYVADVTDRPGLVAVLAKVEADLGPIDVLEYSPQAAGTPVAVTDVTPEDVPSVIEPVLGAVAAVNAVLPGMRQRKAGALLFTTGASSVIPFPVMGNVGIASAGLRNYVLALHQALAPEGIYAAHVALDLFIERGDSEADPDALAARVFDLYEQRDQPELKLGNYIEQALATATGPHP